MNTAELSKRVEPDVSVYVEIARMLCGVTELNLENLQRAIKDDASRTVAEIERWSRYLRQYRAGLKWWAALVHIASLVPGNVIK